MRDNSKLSKLMELTNSSFDGEVLNAIRKANEEITHSGITWTEVLKEKETPIIIEKIVYTDKPNQNITKLFVLMATCEYDKEKICTLKHMMELEYEHRELSLSQKKLLNKWGQSHGFIFT